MLLLKSLVLSRDEIKALIHIERTIDKEGVKRVLILNDDFILVGGVKEELSKYVHFQGF